MRRFIILFILIGAILGTALAYNPEMSKSDDILQKTDVVSQQMNIKDLETYKVTNFKQGEVFVRAVPKISSKEDTQEYLDQRKETTKYLSTTQPERIVDVTVTLDRKHSVIEFEDLLEKHNLKPVNYMYKSYPEGVGVLSTEISDELINEMETDLKEEYKKQGCYDFRLIDGIVSFKTQIPAKDLVELQNDPIVFLADPGPLDVYTKNPDAEVFVAVDYIYPTYEKVW
ncbi:MAG: hypothetical protein R6U44_09620 [Archaeoglobaceae archaeon]